MMDHLVTIRSAKSSTWLLIGTACAFFTFGVYWLFSSSPEYAIIPFGGVLGLLLIWLKYHRGRPAWVIIDKEGLRLPMIFPGLVRWQQIQEITPYAGFRGDSGIKVRFNRYLKADGTPDQSTLTYSTNEHTTRIKVSLINCALNCSPSELAEALNRIRSQEEPERLGHLERLRAIV